VSQHENRGNAPSQSMANVDYLRDPSRGKVSRDETNKKSSVVIPYTDNENNENSNSRRLQD
jgi:hypothetical protein